MKRILNLGLYLILSGAMMLCAPFLYAGTYEDAMATARRRMETDNVNVLRVVRGHALDALRMAADARQRDAAAALLNKILLRLSEREGIELREQLTLRLQAAGTLGLGGGLAGMETRIEQLLTDSAGLDPVIRVEAVWDAAVFFVHARHDDVARVFHARKEALHEQAATRNVHACGFVPVAPAGAGGWAASDFVQDAANRESRFHPYPRMGEGYALEADMAGDRPLPAGAQAALEGRRTAFFMAYDTKGWHIYVQTDEPEVERVMLEDGRGGSSLEMFFAPGLERETYYQWILNLGTGTVNLYHWISPNREARRLEHEPGGFQVETAVLENGWGTAIFIPWEVLYDKLPFVEGNDTTWRFTICRWGPVRMTWGGRVHETGRWGWIDWQPPSDAQRLAIQRRLIQRAWWRFQTAKNTVSGELETLWDYWQCERRGDPAFYREMLAPFKAQFDDYTEKIKTLEDWDAQTVEAVFAQHVPVWMGVTFEIDALRAAYLTRRLLDW